LSTTNCN